MHSVKSFMAFFEKKVNFFLPNRRFFRFFDDLSVIFEKKRIFLHHCRIAVTASFFSFQTYPLGNQSRTGFSRMTEMNADRPVVQNFPPDPDRSVWSGHFAGHGT